MKAWYFSDNKCTLGYNDGRAIVAGETHTVDGTPKLCEWGLHGSERIIDALIYAPGSYIWSVDIDHNLDIGNDKLCGSSRHYYWGFDAEQVLREFARKVALLNIAKIKPYCSAEDYPLILRWLETGDESIRKDAWSAIWSDAWSAIWSAAESAARSATMYAAEAAAWSAAESAAWSAARSATGYAAEAAAWSAARSVARSAARSAARSEMNTMLEQMILDEAKRGGFN